MNAFEKLFTIFDNAATKLRFPKIVLEHNGSKIRLVRCGPNSRYQGDINVEVDGNWMGRIERDGNVYGHGRSIIQLQNSPAPYYDACMHVLQFAADPHKQAAIHGHAYNYCCFCSRELTNAVSVHLGYGPICADKYGLPHSIETCHENVEFNSLDSLLVDE